MRKEGNLVSEENMQSIFSPAGLDIGAATPEEIALSICAEIRSVFANRNGMSLRFEGRNDLWKLNVSPQRYTEKECHRSFLCASQKLRGSLWQKIN